MYQAVPMHILLLMEANGPGKRDLGVMPMVFGLRTSGSKSMVSIGVAVTLECMIRLKLINKRKIKRIPRVLKREGRWTKVKSCQKLFSLQGKTCSSKGLN